MSVTMESLGIDRLSVEERLKLVEEIWNSIAADSQRPPLRESVRALLDSRIAEYQANPENVVTWEQAKASILARLKK